MTVMRADDEGVYGEIKDTVATLDPDVMDIVVRVAPEKEVLKGDQIVITYANATAPADA